MNWEPITIGGVVYDLAHVQPFVMQTQAAGKPQRNILVSFGCHCFARDAEAGDPTDHLIEDGKRKKRCFCPTRYAQSQGLESIVRSTVGRPVFFTQQRDNMVLVASLPGLSGPYSVFFTVKPSTAKNVDVHMFVASAYEKQNLVRKMHAISLVTLVEIIASGGTPKRPPHLSVVW